MAYRLQSFAGVELPISDASRVRTMQPRSGVAMSPRGVVDFYAGGSVPSGIRQVTLATGNFSTDYAALRTLIDLFTALEGTRGALVARYYADALERFAWARLDTVTEQSDENAADLGSLAFNWTLLQPHWYGTWRGESAANLGGVSNAWYARPAGWPAVAAPAAATDFGGNVTLYVNNQGNISTTHVVLRVVVLDTLTTSLTITNATTGRHSITLDLSALDPDDVILLDATAGTTTVNGTYDASILSLESAHTAAQLFGLAAGVNELTLDANTTLATIPPTVSVSFYDAWS